MVAQSAVGVVQEAVETIGTAWHHEDIRMIYSVEWWEVLGEDALIRIGEVCSVVSRSASSAYLSGESVCAVIEG